MTFPTVETTSVGAETGNETSHTVNLPSGIVSGDLLVVEFSYALPNTTTFPAGWTNFITRNNGNGIRTDAAWRDADGTEGASITVTTNDNATRSDHAVYRISGAEDPDTQAPEVSTGATGTDASPDPDSLTPTGGAKDYLWIALMGSDDASDDITAGPTSYTNLLVGENGSSLAIHVASAERQLNASSEDPGTFTLENSEEWLAATYAVHPAPPAVVAPHLTMAPYIPT